MSRNPAEFITDAEEQLAFARELAEKHPKAYRQGTTWIADLDIDECDSVLVSKDDGESGPLSLTIGKSLAGGTVWMRARIAIFPEVMVPGGEDHDSLRVALLDWVRAAIK